MADVDSPKVQAVTAGSVTATAQLPIKKEKKQKSPRSKPSHPPTSEMVNNAIKSLKERGGSSLQAIKKYVSANYKIDSEKMAPFIKKYLKAAVASGSLVQTKGKGASGSFKLASTTSMAAHKATTGDKKKTVKSTISKAKKTASTRKVAANSASTNASNVAVEKTSKSSPKKHPSPKAKKTGVSKVKKSTTAAQKKPVVASVAVSAPVTEKTTSRKLSKSPLKGKKANKAGPTKKVKAPKPKTVKTVAAKAKKANSPKRKK